MDSGDLGELEVDGYWVEDVGNQEWSYEVGRQLMSRNLKWVNLIMGVQPNSLAGTVGRRWTVFVVGPSGIALGCFEQGNVGLSPDTWTVLHKGESRGGWGLQLLVGEQWRLVSIGLVEPWWLTAECCKNIQPKQEGKKARMLAPQHTGCRTQSQVPDSAACLTVSLHVRGWWLHPGGGRSLK